MKRIRAGAIDFAYLDHGSSPDPLALCVHGFPDSAHTFDALLPRLSASGFHAVAPFMRGYAPTSIPRDRDYSIRALANDLLGLIDAFEKKSAVLIAHDWGASAAYAASILAPDRVQKLVTIAIPHPIAITPTPRIAYRLRHFIPLALPFAARRLRREGRGDLPILARLYRRWSPAWTPTQDDLQTAYDALSPPGALEAALGYYRAFVLAPWCAFAWQKPISVPTLTFAGENDGGLPLSAFDDAPRGFTGSYRLVKVPNAGHFLHREAPNLVAEEIIRFIAPA